jgi:hypothetical protein
MTAIVPDLNAHLPQGGFGYKYWKLHKNFIVVSPTPVAKDSGVRI